MSPRRLLLSCLLLAACPPRTTTERPPDDPPPGDDSSTPAVVESMPPDSDLAPPAPDDPDAPDEPGEVEPGERPAPRSGKPASSRANDQVAETLSAGRTSRQAATGRCEQGTRRVGETWKVDCNECSCGDDGQSTCTAMACKPAPAL